MIYLAGSSFELGTDLVRFEPLIPVILACGGTFNCSPLYHQQREWLTEDLRQMRQIDEQYLLMPVYGSRRTTVHHTRMTIGPTERKFVA